MFSLTVTEQEIHYTLYNLEDVTYPKSVTRQELSRIVFGNTSDIHQRKIRLCITELRKRGYFIIAKRGYSFAGNEAEPSIHFINSLYSRANKLKAEADLLYGLAKEKYGDKECAKVEPSPSQAWLGIS